MRTVHQSLTILLSSALLAYGQGNTWDQVRSGSVVLNRIAK